VQINQLDLQTLKLTASADRLKQLSPSAELTLQTQLAEAESGFAAKQNEMADVTAQLQDHREVLAALQQVLPLQLLLLLQRILPLQLLLLLQWVLPLQLLLVLQQVLPLQLLLLLQRILPLQLLLLLQQVLPLQLLLLLQRILPLQLLLLLQQVLPFQLLLVLQLDCLCRTRPLTIMLCKLCISINSHMGYNKIPSILAVKNLGRSCWLHT